MMRDPSRTHLRGALPVVLLLLATPTVLAENSLTRIFSKWGLFEDLQLSGYNSLTFQKNSVEGSADAYQGQRWDTDEFMHQSSLHAEGSIWKEFGFQADFSASGYGSGYSRWLLGYVGHDTAAYYGDLNVDLGGNEFVAFRKTLKGWQVDQVLPRDGILRYFESEEKGLVRRQTFSGNNTAGPYFLTYTPIIEGSEIIKINEERLQFGRHYRLDYDTGELWFEPVDGPLRIVPETDAISASYQSYGYGGAPSTLTGLRFEMPLMNRRMLVGYTRLEEKRPSKQGDTVGYHEDIYNGSGTTGPFDTTFRPIVANGTRVTYGGETKVIEQSLVVLVDNVEQKEALDYDTNRSLGRILFRRAVPPTSLVVVKYYYDLSSTANIGGGSEVWGVDVGWTVTPSLTLKYDYGRSFSQTSGEEGSAQKLVANYQTDRLRLAGEWRSIDPAFSFLDAVGFYRHEKGYQWRADWEVAEATTVYYDSSELESSQGYSFGYSGYTGGENFGSYSPYGTALSYTSAAPAGGPGSWVNSQQETPKVSLDVTAKRTSYGFRFAKPRWPGIQLDIQKMENLGGASGTNSSYDARQLRVQYVPTNAPYSISLDWSDTAQDALSLSGAETVPTHSGTKRFQAAVSYTPSHRLSLSANLGKVDTDSGADSRSFSDTLQVSASWQPSDKLSLRLDRSSAKSTGTSLSTYSGYSGSGWNWSPGGYGVYSYGVLPGQTDDTGDEEDDDEPTLKATHYEDSSTSASITYQPSSRLSLDLQLGRRTYKSGGTGYLSDSNQTYRNASLLWQFTDALSLQASYGTDTMQFLQEDQGTVSNKMMSLGLNYRPAAGKWGAMLMYNKQTGSSPTYVGFGRGQQQIVVGTNLTDLSSRIYYNLGENMDVYLQMGTASYSGGYAAFDKQTAELGIERRLSDTSRATFGYRYIRNITDESGLLPAYSSVTSQSQDYIASTWLLTVNMNFHSGGGRSGFRSPTTGTGYYGSGYGGGYGMGRGYGGYGGSLTTFGGYSSDLFSQRQGFGGSSLSSVFGGGYGGGYGSGGPFGGYAMGGGSAGGYGGMGGVFGGAPQGSGEWRAGAPTLSAERSDEVAAVPPDPWEAVGDGVSLW